MTDIDHFIDELTEQAEPVTVRSTEQGRLFLGIIGVLTIVAVAMIFGLRDDVAVLAPSPLITVTAGLLALLAVASGAHAVRMARPQVGAPTSGAPWLVAAILLLPLATIGAIAASPEQAAALSHEQGVECLVIGMSSGLASLAFLGLWLHQGAPVAPERAAWLAGLAAGGIGSVAVTLECGFGALAHLASWHVGIVVVMALFARLLLPRFIRW